MKNNEGYFKKGDCIEISGKKTYIVVAANEDEVQVRSIMWYKNPPILENRIDIYSNSNENYSSKYWIKIVPAPLEYGSEILNVLAN